MPRTTRTPDVVVLIFRRNRVTQKLEILDFCILGSASPCIPFLAGGASLGRAIVCLLQNRFRVVAIRSNIAVFRRPR